MSGKPTIRQDIQQVRQNNPDTIASYGELADNSMSWGNAINGSIIMKDKNSIIVDDRLGNVSHENNLYNGIACQGFAPFHETKARAPLTKESLSASINDTMFLDLIKIIENSFRYIDGCSKKECKDAFSEESIFSPKNIKKNGNIKYVQDIKKIKIKDGVETEKTYTMVAIGDVSLAGSQHKGGSIKKNIKKKSRKTRKPQKKYNNKNNKTRYTKK